MCTHVEHVQLLVDPVVLSPTGVNFALTWLRMKWHMMCMWSEELQHVFVTKCHFQNMYEDYCSYLFNILQLTFELHKRGKGSCSHSQHHEIWADMTMR